MSSQTDQKPTTDPPVSTLPASDLIAFNNHFIELQGACTFLCDSIVALTTAQLELAKASVHGLHMYSGTDEATGAGVEGTVTGIAGKIVIRKIYRLFHKVFIGTAKQFFMASGKVLVPPYNKIPP